MWRLGKIALDILLELMDLLHRSEICLRTSIIIIIIIFIIIIIIIINF